MLYLLQILFLVKIKPTSVLSGSTLLSHFFLNACCFKIFKLAHSVNPAQLL